MFDLGKMANWHSILIYNPLTALLSNLFKKDNYADRGSPDHWLKFTFPFWFTDLISAMDSLSILGFPKDEPQIEKAVQWFVSHQQINGLWNLKTLKNKKYMSDFWLSLAICRIIERLYDELKFIAIPPPA